MQLCMHILFDCSVSDAACLRENTAYACIMPSSVQSLAYCEPESVAAADEKSSSVYLSIISQQTFIGCWKLNAELSSLLGVSLAQLQKSAPVKVSLI